MFFAISEVGSHFFERIPQNMVGTTFLVHWEITFEHATTCPKRIDGMVYGTGQLRRQSRQTSQANFACGNRTR